jgi:rhodanese-related sulfurtransferase
MQDISVEELVRKHEADPNLVLVDVRDADELETVSVAWATWIPLPELPQRLGELDKNAEIALMCHHGGRSARAAAFLSAQGFTRVYNVDGGVDAYAQRIDPSLARY